MVAFAGGFRAPFARYWLSKFLADFGDGVRLAAFRCWPEPSPSQP